MGASQDPPDSSADARVVGRIARPHGVRGEVAVDLLTDVPERRFVVGRSFDVLPAAAGTAAPAALPARLTLDAARPHAGRLLVRFAELPDRTSVEPLRGALLAIPDAEAGRAADEPDEDVWWDEELIGLTVETVDGQPLGRVVDVAHTPGGELLIVAGEAGERLIPFVREVVPEVDVAAGRLRVDPPPGLLEL